MNVGLFIINNPSGTFGFVGNIPTVICDIVPAKKCDVLGGRAFYDDNNQLVTAKPPSFNNINDAVTHVEKCGVECQLPLG